MGEAGVIPARRESTEVLSALIARALELPEAWEDHPWDEIVIKVGKKIFLFAGLPGSDEQRITIKLTDSHEQALAFRSSAPAGYGLGRSGWVTVLLGEAPSGILEDWVDESYRNVAPKRLVARMSTEGGAGRDREGDA